MKRALLGGGAAVIGVLLFAPPALATDFHVLEAIAGSDFRGRSTLGLGYTFDAFVTSKSLRGALVGTNVNALYCHYCDKTFGGGWLNIHALFTFWKDDLSVVTPYFGLAGGGGFSRWNDAAFGQIEGQIALQSRALYQGWWIRPTIFAGYSGAYDEHATFGLRIAIGYAFNHGTSPPPGEKPACAAQVCGRCDIPKQVELSASADTLKLCNCSQATGATLDGGRSLNIHADGNDLIIDVGRADPGTGQTIKIDIAGGAENVTVIRRDCSPQK